LVIINLKTPKRSLIDIFNYTISTTIFLFVPKKTKRNLMFIIIEGIDGTGKSTLLRNIEDRINSDKELNQIVVFKKREPTTGNIGTLIRNKISNGFNIDDLVINKYLESLFFIDRIENIFDKDSGVNSILKNKNHLVLQDRYWMSTLAYQGKDINSNTLNEYEIFPEPDLLIYLDLDVDKALSRIDNRNTTKDIFETKDKLSNIKKVYEELLKQYKGNYIKLDANLSEEDIANKAYKSIKELIQKNI